MKTLIAAVLAGASLHVTGMASAQEAVEPTVREDIPRPPEIQAPGWPPPKDLCKLPDSFDFTKEPLNPGLYTFEQYRTWAISGVDKDNPSEAFFLGLMYEYGQGVGKDMPRAVELYKQAAEAGLDRAYARLGTYYCSRELYCTAARNYYAGAQNDDGESQKGLSRLYRWGLGVHYDPVEAYRWGYLGMEKTPGNWLVHDMPGVRYLRDILDNITAADEVEAEERIERWKKGYDVPVLQCKVDE